MTGGNLYHYTLPLRLWHLRTNQVPISWLITRVFWICSVLPHGFPWCRTFILFIDILNTTLKKILSHTSLNTFQLRALSIFFVHLGDDHQILVASAQPQSPCLTRGARQPVA